MSEVMSDGHVFSSNIKQYTPIANPKQYLGLLKVKIEEVIYTDDSRNYTQERFGVKIVQYVCRVIGSQYDGNYLKNVVNASSLGGQYNYSEVVRTGIEQGARVTGSGDRRPSLSPGDYALVLCLFGDLESGVIISGFPHPQCEEIGATKEDGTRSVWEFNGVKISVDKDSNIAVEQVGRKDQKGVIENPEAVGTSFSISGVDGTIQAITSNNCSLIIENELGNESVTVIHKTNAILQIDKDGSAKIIGTDGAYISLDANGEAASLVSKQGSIIALGEGITVADSTGNQMLEMKDNLIQIFSGKDALVNAENVTLTCNQTILGSDDFSAVLSEKLSSLFDAHTHFVTSPASPTSPPLPPNTYAIMDSTPITAISANNIKLKGNL